MRNSSYFNERSNVLSVEAALGLMIGFATLVVTIIFGILALVLTTKITVHKL